MKIKKVFCFSFLLIFLFLLSGCKESLVSLPEEPDDLIYGEVVYVIDGDTFIFKPEGGDNEIKVRLIGVDTPESVHPDESKNTEEGIIASNYTKDALLYKAVGLEYDVQKEDKYGRHLCYVWIDGELYNKKLLDEGYAALMTIPPNIKYVDYLKGE